MLKAFCYIGFSREDWQISVVILFCVAIFSWNINVWIGGSDWSASAAIWGWLSPYRRVFSSCYFFAFIWFTLSLLNVQVWFKIKFPFLVYLFDLCWCLLDKCCRMWEFGFKFPLFFFFFYFSDSAFELFDAWINGFKSGWTWISFLICSAVIGIEGCNL